MIDLDAAIKNREGCLAYLQGCKTLASPEGLDAAAWSVLALHGMRAARSSEDLDSMPLDDAIKHCLEDVEALREGGCDACAREHEQLARWLSELAFHRAHAAGIESLKDHLPSVIRVLENERDCVRRQAAPGCDRECGKCDLVLPEQEVIGAYRIALFILRRELRNEKPGEGLE